MFFSMLGQSSSSGKDFGKVDSSVKTDEGASFALLISFWSSEGAFVSSDESLWVIKGLCVSLDFFEVRI